MTSAASVDPLTFYEAFHDKGILYDTLPCTAAHVILELIGFYGNFSIAYATYKHKQLWGTCGFLLSIGSIADTLHQLSHFYLAYLMFSGKTFTDLQTCVLVNTIPIIGLTVGLFMTFFIGVDRLMSVLFPARHRVINKTMYISIYFITVSVYCIVCLVMIYVAMLQAPTTPTTCLITDAMPGGVGQTWFTICLITNCATVACYIIVGIFLKFKTSSASDATRRMFKSLAAITAMVFVGWAINACIQVSLRALQAAPITYWYTGFYAGLPVNVACSCNYFVLFAFSKDYRIAFKRQINVYSMAIFKRDLVALDDNARIQKITTTNGYTSTVTPVT
uniref:G-protein coupled receptors family 1 profile domain-containing protein n=1 Tax=Panagrolaimus sp. ES5 TaxID=591445 RepID=A0AC34FVG9_9BILA